MIADVTPLARACLPSRKTVFVAALLVVGGAVPHSDGQNAGDPVVTAPYKVAGLSDFGGTRSNVIPDPVPVPMSWTAQPIVIDLK